MNQRVPDSGGLPLRAMVMVLLFLAIIFLLLGINAVRSGSGSNQATPVVTPTTTTSSTPAAPKADVHVYNISGVEGAAARAGDRLTQAGWNVIVEPGTLEAPDVTATTVFFTDAPGERESAGEVAKILDNAPVELRRPELVDLPPGVIVTVTG